jgi:hypothetical protein
LGKGYAEMARDVSNETEANYKQALRITRTEAGRINSLATQKGYEEAQAKGIKLQKQWAATWDMKVRTDHRILDGQKVDVDGYFEVYGMKAKMPHTFGIAGEDVNCRCTTYSIVDDIAPEIRNDDGTLSQWQSYKEWLEGRTQAMGNLDKEAQKVRNLKESVKIKTDEEKVRDAGKKIRESILDDELNKAYDKTYNLKQLNNNLDELNGKAKRFEISRDEYEKLWDAEIRKYNNAKFNLANTVSKKLSKQIELGTNTPLNIAYQRGLSNKALEKDLKTANNYLPTRWTDKFNSQPIVIQNKPRGFYNSNAFKNLQTGEDIETIAASVKDYSSLRLSTMLHEQTHRVESNIDGIVELEAQFFNRRTAGQPEEYLRDITGNASYGDEKAIKDNFANPYMGKKYSDSYEILTNGMEQLFFGQEDIRKDTDLMDFILGVLSLGGK